MVGLADFDLSKYVNNYASDKVIEDRLPLKNCSLDPGAYIEI